MNDRYKIIAPLILKHLSSRLSEKEKQYLLDWVNESEENALLFNRVTNKKVFNEAMKDFDKARLEKERRKLVRSIAGTTPGWAKLYLLSAGWKKYAAAAAVFFIAIAGCCIWVHRASIERRASVKESMRKVTPVNIMFHKKENAIQPDNRKAVLILSDGSTKVLDNDRYSLVARQELHGSDGQLIYNTVATPRGRQFEVVLSDSTRVWLNAASSIRFPVVFEKNERKVMITGEAYFEVAKSRNRPFLVMANNGVEVNVLGTHFNINSYEIDAIKTTLLEGAIQLKKDGKSRILKPGQGAMVDKAGRMQVKYEKDSENAIAWKSGTFYFDSVTIKTVMQEISRWYDVEVTYEKGFPRINVSGGISRNLPIDQVLNFLNEGNNVRMVLTGRTITVSSRQAAGK